MGPVQGREETIFWSFLSFRRDWRRLHGGCDRRTQFYTVTRTAVQEHGQWGYSGQGSQRGGTLSEHSEPHAPDKTWCLGDSRVFDGHRSLNPDFPPTDPVCRLGFSRTSSTCGDGGLGPRDGRLGSGGVLPV